MRRGEVWVANLNPNRGREVGKIRPVLVLQADLLTITGTATVIVLPMTTQVDAALEPLRVTIAPREKLKTASQVVTEQPRTIDRDRFGEGPLTMLSPEEMEAVEKAFKAVVGLY